jgi:hypothetical protein
MRILKVLSIASIGFLTSFSLLHIYVLSNYDDEVNGGWVVDQFIIDGHNLSKSLLKGEMIIFHPNRKKSMKMLLLDLQPLPDGGDSKAHFSWSLLGKSDSVFIVDKRYDYLTGGWGVNYIDSYVPEMTLTTSNDTIHMKKITLFGNNKLPL